VLFRDYALIDIRGL